MAVSPRKTRNSSAAAAAAAATRRKTWNRRKVEPEISENDEDDGVEEVTEVNNASLSELKNALDDATKNHCNEDFKLGVGWLASLVAGGISLAGWYYGWEKTQGYTGYCICVFSFVLILFAIIVDKETIYIGKRSSKKSGSSYEKVTISSDVKSFEPIYRLGLVIETDKKDQTKRFNIDLKPHFNKYFDVDGYLDESGWNKFLDKALSDALSKI
ncbi:microsomal signal peptidase 25 kDa subunit-domain-containing protein [Phakopsora pachyrhizi]|uniref:Signal peptidase complex subunit 2 n=1 Tax=Phakopsora pachyrhizi TaxID=170000 RepID=A0AAV0BW25_PHAPC|nr:microsomal signal peptidase 25 kDa subunit-domain-containing protein [Phakopsora pachyrhizi]